MSEPTLTTRTIGETESALGQLLRRVLGDSGLDELGWITLRLVSTMPPPVPADEVSAQLRRSRKIDAETAASVLSDLEASGVMESGENAVSLTHDGTGLLQQLNREIGQLTAQMWDGLDPADTAVAARVLMTITERANELLSA